MSPNQNSYKEHHVSPFSTTKTPRTLPACSLVSGKVLPYHHVNQPQRPLELEPYNWKR